MNAKRRGFFRGGICRGWRIWRGERGLTVFWIGLALAAGLAGWFGVADLQPWLGRDIKVGGHSKRAEV